MARLFGPFFALAVILLDQLTKYTATELLFRPTLEQGPPMTFMDWLMHAPERLGPCVLVISSFFNLSMVWNTGISFGFLGNDLLGQYSNLIITVVTVAISGIFIIWMSRSLKIPEIIALALIVGGALGNVIDRVRFGAVIDYLDFHWNGWHFPAFNIADASISIGVAILIIHGLFFAKETD